MKTGLRLLYSKKQIDNAVDDIVEKICDDKELGKDFVVICVLKGGFVFCADLVRLMPMIPQIDFITAQSYVNDKGTGYIKLLTKQTVDIEGKSVLLVDDIMNTGSTIYHLVKTLKKSEPKIIKSVVLLWKKETTIKGVVPDYHGFVCNDKHIIGYGMDSKDKMRHLPQIYCLEK